MQRPVAALRVVMVAAIAAVTIATNAHAQQAIRFTPESKIVIEGTSNVHKWTCATSTFEANVDVPTASANLGKALTGLVITIPVKSLDCGHADMNNNLRKAMHADRYPTIRYRMTSYVAVPHAGVYEGIVQGVLTINGEDHPTELRATITPNGAGSAGVIGSAPVNTNDYGVKRISLYFGTLRTSSKVTITFRLAAARP